MSEGRPALGLRRLVSEGWRCLVSVPLRVPLPLSSLAQPPPRNKRMLGTVVPSEAGDPREAAYHARRFAGIFRLQSQMTSNFPLRHTSATDFPRGNRSPACATDLPRGNRFPTDYPRGNRFPLGRSIPTDFPRGIRSPSPGATDFPRGKRLCGPTIWQVGSC